MVWRERWGRKGEGVFQEAAGISKWFGERERGGEGRGRGYFRKRLAAVNGLEAAAAAASRLLNHQWNALWLKAKNNTNRLFPLSSNLR